VDIIPASCFAPNDLLVLLELRKTNWAVAVDGLAFDDHYRRQPPFVQPGLFVISHKVPGNSRSASSTFKLEKRVRVCLFTDVRKAS
jgi:hypothetical protein